MKNIFTFKQKRMVFFGFEAGNTEPDQLGVTVPRKKSPEESRKEEEENKRKRDEAEKRGKEETERNIKEYKEEMPKILHEYSDVIKKNESSGKVTYRVDKFANLHIPAGKLSFGEDMLKDNIKAILAAVIKERPATLKGVFIKSITLCTTMGPGIKLQVASATLEAKS